MPAETEEQRRLMCLALSIKLGKTPASKSPEAAKLAKQMSAKELGEFCHSKVKE
jgi:hypothetical protein